MKVENPNKPIDMEGAYEWVGKNHESALLKLMNGKGIYRGIKKQKDPFLYVQPSKFVRKSANTANIYTALLDILPSWKEYPKRSRSVICSNNTDYAGSYIGHFGGTVGSLYCVIPKNGAKIGVCSEEDIWNSFPIVRDRWSGGPMNDFNYFFREIMSLLWVKSTKKEYKAEDIDEMNGEEMEKFLNESEKVITFEIAGGALFDSGESLFRGIGKDILEKKFRKNRTWIEYFDDLMNPVDNSFQLQTIEDYNPGNYSHEVWTDADCLLIRMSEFDEDGNRVSTSSFSRVKNVISKSIGKDVEFFIG